MASDEKSWVRPALGMAAVWAALAGADLKAGVRLQVQRADHKLFLMIKAGDA